MQFVSRALPVVCANLDCPNKPGEGTFVLVRSNELIVGGHRALTLYVCYPCAEALKEIAK